MVAFAVGIVGYFAWPAEPIWWWGLIGLGVLLLCARFAAFRPRLSSLIVLCMFCLAGFSRSALHTKSVYAPILPDYERSYTVTGWVENVDKAGALQHFYIRVQDMQGIDADKTPYRIRIRIKPHGFVAGDSIRIKAVMTGPRMPALLAGMILHGRRISNALAGLGLLYQGLKPSNYRPLLCVRKLNIAW